MEQPRPAGPAQRCVWPRQQRQRVLHVAQQRASLGSRSALPLPPRHSHPLRRQPLSGGTDILFQLCPLRPLFHLPGHP